jgi:hypothetical protein
MSKANLFVYCLQYYIIFVNRLKYINNILY